ncbi:ABC-type antimicrobial peptide transport system, permease component [Solitalea canadensis DSM 3403]|uniref:ABC-type antimicrobial peptide transport system, permease component n=2 Tax=Solitalea canadensis TaxID=995 RepID=H8KSU5_SOLCM|nr:ABC-type antimicrobial peptide transport system, permease component [Solitalea canadensis DSM 3403]
MIRNYIKIAWRSFMKNKTFTFINIFGLATGLVCCLLIALYLNHELNYDASHKKGDRIYLLGTIFSRQGNENKSAGTPFPMGPAMQQEFPEIEQTTHLLKAFADDKTLLQYNENGKVKSFYETRGYLTDSAFFNVFTYSFKEGNAAIALKEPNTIVISDKIAAKIFGEEPALGKVIHINSNTNGEFDFKVAGVFTAAKIPSHIDAQFFMSIKGGGIDSYIGSSTDMVSNNMFYTYFLLKPEADWKGLEAKFPAFIEKHTGKELRAAGVGKKQYLTPLKKIHLDTTTENTATPPGSRTYLYILASVAFFTLLIACINFMNLSTARSAKRSTEVGVRKVLGAEKSSLIRQFLSESLLMSFFAFLFAIVVTWALTPLFGQLAGKDLNMSVLQHGWLLVAFFALAIITGLLAGIYPAYFLSSLRPVKALKGKLSNSLAAVSIRKFLVVFQFVISVVLIVSSVVIYNQMDFMREKDLGFEKEQQIVVPLRSSTAKKMYASLKEEVGRDPHVVSAGGCYFYPGIMNASDMRLYPEGKTIEDARLVFMNYIDDSYLKTLQIKPVAGQLFSKEFATDSITKVVLTEKTIKDLGFASAQQAVDKSIWFNWQGRDYKFIIIGVVNDFNFQDLRTPIKAMGFQLADSNFNYLIVHANASSIQHVLKSIEAKWQKLNPNEPFEYTFLDADFAKTFQAENRLLSIVGYFTLIAILISCLGLFGLATYSAEQRIKEIGIRKVLGASISSIVLLLSKDFLKPVLLATLIAFPIGWYAMHKWLEDFAYRTNIGWSVFLIAGVLAVAIALITVSFQAIKAAIANPVKSLKTE